jgi:hypothetical protein
LTHGGLWALSKTGANDTHIKYIPPVSNTAFCFRNSRVSFHALAQRNRGCSYSIICRFLPKLHSVAA